MAAISVQALARYAPGPSPNRVAESRQFDDGEIELLVDDPLRGGSPVLYLHNGDEGANSSRTPEVQVDVSGEDGPTLAARAAGGLEEIKLMVLDGSHLNRVPGDRLVERGWLNMSRVSSVAMKSRGVATDVAVVKLDSGREVWVSEPSAAVLALAS